MLNAGVMRYLLTVQKPVDGLDALGSPTRSWVDACQSYGAIENEQFDAGETNNAPFESATQTCTFILRNNPGVLITTKMRVINHRDSGSVWAITAIRYDGKQTTLFIDCIAGASDG